MAASRAHCNRIRIGWLAALGAAALLHPLAVSAFEYRTLDTAHGAVTFEILDASLPIYGRFHRFVGQATFQEAAAPQADGRPGYL